MMSKKLLREYYALCDGNTCKDLLTEDEKRFIADGGMILTGVMQKSDTRNGNGRVYPHNVLMREMKNYRQPPQVVHILWEMVFMILGDLPVWLD